MNIKQLLAHDLKKGQRNVMKTGSGRQHPNPQRNRNLLRPEPHSNVQNSQGA
jgi:hypothetical protein